MWNELLVGEQRRPLKEQPDENEFEVENLATFGCDPGHSRTAKGLRRKLKMD